MRLALAWLLPALLFLSGPLAAADKPREDPAQAEDAQLLKKEAKVAADGASLLKFLRDRTPDGARQKQLAALVQQLDSNQFMARQQASQELEEAGPAALPFLRAATVRNSLEVTRRAERCIETITQAHNPNLPAAAARLLRVRRPDGACRVLLDYVPFADDQAVEEEVLAALVTVGLKDGKPDRLLADAVQDRDAARRAAAALVVGRSGDAEQRKMVCQLLRDADPRVCLRAAQGLVAGRDKKAVAALVSMVSGAPIDLAVQAEELLQRVAGDKAPGVSLTDSSSAVRRKCREAWDAWWKANEMRLDLARADLDVTHESTSLRARDLTRRFRDALIKPDAAACKKLTDAPFYWFALEDLSTREALEKFWDTNLGGGLNDLGNNTYDIRRMITVDEFLKNCTAEAAAFLKPMQKGTIRVVLVDVTNKQGEIAHVGVMIRISGRFSIRGVSLIGITKKN